MAHATSLSIDGVSYASVRAAARALHARGLDNPAMAVKLGVTASRVPTILTQCGLKSHRTQAPAAPTASETAWTENKVETAVRLFSACLEEVARHLAVPSTELRDLWVKGRQPALPAPIVISPPAYEPPPREAFEPAEGDEPDRDDDEAELARLQAEEETELKPEAPAEPVSRFPAPAVAASPIPAPRLIPPGGLFPAGHEVRLKRADGKYLHESLQGFTDKVKYAWCGPRLQYDTIKARMPKVVGKLSMEVVA